MDPTVAEQSSSKPDAEVAPLGVKGLGETGIVGTAAAVVNAIHHATRTRVRSLPATSKG